MACCHFTLGALLLSALLHSTIAHTTRSDEPQFLAPLENHTVIQGRDVSFTCVVNHLQSYKVAWLKSDSREILAMQTHMIAANPRMFVTHNGHNTWKLHVLAVRAEDSGTYMCQVNTQPMSSLTGRMKVLVPPDIVEPADWPCSSMEHAELSLRCHATGSPRPRVTWRREDGRNIVLRNDAHTVAIKTYVGEQLQLRRLQRQEMGSYLCIASNGVPPSVSKRHYVKVLFKPSIQIKNELVWSIVGANASLHCYVESSPKALVTWYRHNGVKVVTSDKQAIMERALNDYTHQVSLSIAQVRHADFGRYTCFAQNAFGTANAHVRLREHTNQQANHDKSSNDLDSANHEFSTSAGHYALHSSATPTNPNAKPSTVLILLLVLSQYF